MISFLKSISITQIKQQPTIIFKMSGNMNNDIYYQQDSLFWITFAMIIIVGGIATYSGNLTLRIQQYEI